MKLVDLINKKNTIQTTKKDGESNFVIGLNG